MDQVAILFADVVGSTRLYETLGDEQAKETIDRSITSMRTITERNNGSVIKTIGDEVMCRFGTASAAVYAAFAMQEMTKESGYPPLRIGLHFGPVIIENDGDLFGDAVNLAGRMVGIAKARQILTTGETMESLPLPLKNKARTFDRTTVKGKSLEMVIWEMLWSEEDVTRMYTGRSDFCIPADDRSITLTYRGEPRVISADQMPLQLGRGVQADLVVQTQFVSRIHAVLDFQRGKFVLTDQSTNGSFVAPDGGETVYLRRESIPLQGAGRISLGRAMIESDAKAHLILYRM